jgi:hypothetical protein
MITNSLAKIPTQIDDRHAEVAEKHEDLKRHIRYVRPAHVVEIRVRPSFVSSEKVPNSRNSTDSGNLIYYFGIDPRITRQDIATATCCLIAHARRAQLV